MTDQIQTAQQEGIALGLAMAADKMAASAAQLWTLAEIADTLAEADIHEAGAAALSKVGQAVISLAPIPPHVAAARVLLDDLALALGTDGAPEGVAAGKRWNDVMKVAGLGPFVTRVRAALEHISKEADRG
jgi:hypothetical protein